MLSFYYSTMQGGKSTSLLQRRFNLMNIGKRVLVYTYALDDRYGIGKVTSRMGPQCDAELFKSDTKFEMSENLASIDEVFIDEAQFLTTEQVQQLHKNICTGFGIRVSCYGLRTDFQGNVFEGAAVLLAMADELHEISTLCQCGLKATLNQRIDEQGRPVYSGPVVEIGDDSRYRPVCPRCFYDVGQD